MSCESHVMIHLVLMTTKMTTDMSLTRSLAGGSLDTGIISNAVSSRL